MADVEIAAPLRVASVPAAHPYVAHLELGRAGVELLADPRPPGAEPGRWWPPVMLDADWIDRHADRFDLLHVHFGTESLSTGALSRALDVLAARGRPLVFTAHDLEHPQLEAPGHYAEQLNTLVARADALITLTAGAAAEIHRRWGREATIIPHPRMLPGEAVPTLTAVAARGSSAADGSAEAGAPPLTVAVHLRDLRPNIDGLGTVQTLAAALTRLALAGVAANARVVMFDRVRDEPQAAAIAALTAPPALQLIRRPRLSDPEMWADLLAADVSLLPYRHGTHSGWAELCWDLGLPILGTPVGHIADQHDDPDWLTAVPPGDPDALAEALAGAAGAGLAQRRDRRGELIVARSARRDRAAGGLAEAHREVYAASLSGSDSRSEASSRGFDISLADDAAAPDTPAPPP